MAVGHTPVLDTLYRIGSAGDQEIANALADNVPVEDVAEATTALAAEGLIEESAAAPRRWQITDAGRRHLGHDPGR